MFDIRICGVFPHFWVLLSCESGDKMPEGLGSIKRQLNEFWTKLEKNQKRNFIITVAICITIVIIAIIMLNRTEYVVLYSQLDAQESAEVYEKLKEMKVEPKIEGTSTIMVPKEKEADIRMELTQQGYPKSGFNYDLFFSKGNFGQTDEDRQAILTFQLQERLASSIKMLKGVEDAIVTISMPKTDSFVLKSEQIPVTASVIVKLDPRSEITLEQAKNIEHLVAKSVPGLKEEDITILDTNANVLNHEGNEDYNILGSNFDLQKQLQQELKKQVTDLLEPVFGYKKVAATVNVKLNFDKKTTESVTFQPVIDDQGIVVSREELKEKVQNGAAGGVAGETNNTTQYPELQEGEQGTYDKNQVTTNYEVNEIKEKIEEQQGKIEDLSISVIIDNEQLNMQTLNQVKELVTNAVGTDPERVTVYSMKFDDSMKQDILDAFNQKEQSNKTLSPMMLGIIATIAAVLIMALIIIMRRRKRVEEELIEQQMEQEAEQKEQDEEQQVPEIDLEATEQNQVKVQLEKLASQRPDAVAQLLRNWLNED